MATSVVSPERENLRKSVNHAAATFHSPKYKRELRDLKPRFWVALDDLRLILEQDAAPHEELLDVFKKSYPQLGSPGDFGYGTPCGDALKDVYDRWRDYIQAARVANPDA